MTDDTLARVRAALAVVVPRLVALVRGVPDATVSSVGHWSVGDVLAHLSHVFRFDTDALAGLPVPPDAVTTAGIGALNARLLADDADRDPATLAQRVAVLAREFDDAAARSGDGDVAWLGGARLPPSAVACHLLEECLIHGHDVAHAVGRPWPIGRDHALLAIEHGVLPLVAALPGDALLDDRGAAGLSARIELRLRGGGPDGDGLRGRHRDARRHDTPRHRRPRLHRPRGVHAGVHRPGVDRDAGADGPALGLGPPTVEARLHAGRPEPTVTGPP